MTNTTSTQLGVGSSSPVHARLRKRPLLAYEPLRTPYIICFFAYSFLVLVPIWTIRFAIPALRPRKSWTLFQAVSAKFVKHVTVLVSRCEIQVGPELEKAAPSWSLFRSTFHFAPALDAGFLKGPVAKWSQQAELTFGKVPAFWFVRGGPKAAGGRSPSEWAALQQANHTAELVAIVFHGGAYVVGSAHERSPVGSLPSEILKRVPGVTASLSVDYRLAGVAGFPAALVDAVAVYKYAVESGIPPHRIILTGHSAGGHLALALAKYLRDEKQMSMPEALLLFSPWGDISLTGHHNDANASVRTNADCDILAAGLGGWAQERILGPLPRSVLLSAYLSPCAPKLDPPDDDPASLFAGYPRTYATAGGAEQLLDEIRFLGKRMEQAGVDVVVDDVAKDAPHDYVTMRWQPDADQAWDRIAAWFATVRSSQPRFWPFLRRVQSVRRAARRLVGLRRQTALEIDVTGLAGRIGHCPLMGAARMVISR